MNEVSDEETWRTRMLDGKDIPVCAPRVLYREGSAGRAACFVALVMTLGNAFAALSVLVALLRSRGSWPRFWLGHRFVEGGG